MIKGEDFTMSDKIEVRKDGIYVNGFKTNAIRQYRWIDDPLSVALAAVAMLIVGFKIGTMISEGVTK